MAEQHDERINEQIRAPKVRVVVDGEGNLGVMPIEQALKVAQERSLDLVEVAPSADPPVCKVMDYGKFLYSKKKKERVDRLKQKQIEIKEIRLRPKTDDHHLGFKIRDARRWLTEGMKVKVRVAFRGREITYPELGRDMLVKISEELKDIATVEQEANMDGKTMLMVLAPGAPEKKKS